MPKKVSKKENQPLSEERIQFLIENYHNAEKIVFDLFQNSTDKDPIFEELPFSDKPNHIKSMKALIESQLKPIWDRYEREIKQVNDKYAKFYALLNALPIPCCDDRSLFMEPNAYRHEMEKEIKELYQRITEIISKKSIITQYSTFIHPDLIPLH